MEPTRQTHRSRLRLLQHAWRSQTTAEQEEPNLVLKICPSESKDVLTSGQMLAQLIRSILLAQFNGSQYSNLTPG